jgi:transmembrane sensor
VEIFRPGAARAARSGEAHFFVEKDPQRPFVVNAAGIDVRAVGTAFNVRIDPAAVEVLVTEGRVRVDPAVPHDDPAAPAVSPRASAGSRA